MAEKPLKKRAVGGKQKMLTALAEAEKEVEDRCETELKPEKHIEEQSVRRAKAVADETSLDAVVKSVSDLKSSVSRLLTQVAEKLEAEVEKYGQIRKAVETKEKELTDIFEIQKSASTLVAIIETQEGLREEFESQMAREKAEFQAEMNAAREKWGSEKKANEAEVKDRDAAEQKRRQREQEEYRYAFAREQQLAKEKFADEKVRLEREIALRKQETERQSVEQEQTLTQREAELNELRQRVATFSKQQEVEVAKAIKATAERCQAEAVAKQELTKKEHAGECGVLNMKITSLEQLVADQTKQIGALTQKLEKAYAQVQEIAVKAIEGSANSKLTSNLQQLLSEHVRKSGSEK